MWRRQHALLFLPLLALIAADAAPTRVVRLCTMENRDRWAIVAHPDTLERQTLTLHNVFRRRYHGNDSPLVKLTLSGTGRDASIKEIAPYSVPEAHLQRDTYVFQSAETVGEGAKATLRLKLTRFEAPVDVNIPLGPDAQWMQQRAGKFKKGDLVTARFKGLDNALYDLDVVRPLVRGIYLKDADTTIDNKKFPAILLDVDGEERAFALPPAGQKNRIGDTDVLTLTRKLKKGSPVRLTCDSERPGVIRAIEPDLTILPVGKDDLLLEVPGVALEMNLQPERGAAYARIRPAPGSDADADLLAGFQANRNRDERLEIPHEKRSQIYELLNRFARRKQIDDDQQAINDRLLRLTMGRAYDPKRIMPELVTIALELSTRYRHEVSNSYTDARILLGKDLATQLQARGRELRSRGDTGEGFED